MGTTNTMIYKLKKVHHSLMNFQHKPTLDFKTFEIWKSEKLFMLSQTML